MNLSRIKILSGSHLKWLALVTMMVDHAGMMFCGQSFYPLYQILRGIGRLAFPIFCFLLVEGFYYTHSFKKYICSLAVFAVISEIPYNLAVGYSVFYPEKQNIFFTLFAGLLMIKLLQKRQNFSERMCILLLTGCLAELLHLDYGMFGIMQIAGLYLCREYHVIQYIVLILLNLCQGSLQAFGAVSVVPIACYDGTRGRQRKYFFYAIYPLHLLLFVFIRWGLG